jgi:antitoxin ParD1/3/4
MAEKETPMSSIAKRTVSLPQEHDAYIDRLVASGSFASASEVVRAGLRALQERDQAVERWLREEAASAHDAMKADPARGLSAQAVFDDIRAHHATATAASVKDPL